MRIPHGATKIDARGKTILPGLWDMHAHFEQVEWGPVYLASGATTVRDWEMNLNLLPLFATPLPATWTWPAVAACGNRGRHGALALGVERVNTPEQAEMWTTGITTPGFNR